VFFLEALNSVWIGGFYLELIKHRIMIKQLITDIAFDNIKLSQALTRAKLIENKIKNDIFKKWLNNELEGYEYDDIYLPQYRKIRSQIYLIAEFPFGQTKTFPVELPSELSEINYHKITESIAIVEKQIENFLEKSNGSLPIYSGQIEILAQMFKVPNGIIRDGKRDISKIHYQDVLEQTKQKLLDTLMELDNEFPNLLDEYNMTKENNEKVQNIVTNHIYGNNNPVNVATGVNVEMVINYAKISQEDEEKLKSYGVESQEILELKEIVKNDSSNKTVFREKAMKWLGGVTSAVVGRGVYEHLPQIIEFVNRLTQ
jgi:hypothetical protein